MIHHGVSPSLLQKTNVQESNFFHVYSRSEADIILIIWESREKWRYRGSRNIEDVKSATIVTTSQYDIVVGLDMCRTGSG